MPKLETWTINDTTYTLGVVPKPTAQDEDKTPRVNAQGEIEFVTLPATITEQDVAAWGFTKNTGTYVKPSGGIPASDLADDLKTSLEKADTALQEHQDISGKQEKAITDMGGYYTTDTVEGALQEIGAELAGVNTLIGTGVIT